MLYTRPKEILPREEYILYLAKFIQVSMLTEVELEVIVDLPSLLVVDVVGRSQDEVGRDEGAGALPKISRRRMPAPECECSDVAVGLVAHVVLGHPEEVVLEDSLVGVAVLAGRGLGVLFHLVVK